MGVQGHSDPFSIHFKRGEARHPRPPRNKAVRCTRSGGDRFGWRTECAVRPAAPLGRLRQSLTAIMAWEPGRYSTAQALQGLAVSHASPNAALVQIGQGPMVLAFSPHGLACRRQFARWFPLVGVNHAMDDNKVIENVL